MKNYFESALRMCIERNDLLSREVINLKHRIKNIEDGIESIIENPSEDNTMMIQSLKQMINYKPKDNSY
jgi:hypothetical protein